MNGDRVGARKKSRSPASRPVASIMGSVGGVVIAGACILHVACGEPSHLYTGRLYLETRDCLGTESSIDVVEGDDPGTCSPVCLIDTDPDAARVIYVSTMCGPYPHGTAVNLPGVGTTDPACAPALAAFKRNDTCLSDGGATHPLVDAGPDGADAGGIDAADATDAAADAASD